MLIKLVSLMQLFSHRTSKTVIKVTEKQLHFIMMFQCGRKELAFWSGQKILQFL